MDAGLLAWGGMKLGMDGMEGNGMESCGSDGRRRWLSCLSVDVSVCVCVCVPVGVAGWVVGWLFLSR
jgi:hypothetical protein